jgi:hypothetical protein
MTLGIACFRLSLSYVWFIILSWASEGISRLPLWSTPLPSFLSSDVVWRCSDDRIAEEVDQIKVMEHNQENVTPISI